MNSVLKGAILTSSICRQVLVEDHSGNYMRAKLKLNLWAGEDQVSFLGYLKFEKEQGLCLAFNEDNGDVLGGSQFLQQKTACTMEELGRMPLSSIKQQLQEGEAIDLYHKGSLFAEKCRRLRSIPYGDEIASVIVSKG